MSINTPTRHRYVAIPAEDLDLLWDCDDEHGPLAVALVFRLVEHITMAQENVFGTDFLYDFAGKHHVYPADAVAAVDLLVAAGMATKTTYAFTLSAWDEWQGVFAAKDAARAANHKRSALERWHREGKHVTPKSDCPLCADGEVSA